MLFVLGQCIFFFLLSWGRWRKEEEIGETFKNVNSSSKVTQANTLDQGVDL